MGDSESRRSVLGDCDGSLARYSEGLPQAQGTAIALQFENIVVGSSLNAFLYAFTEQLPIFYTTPERPFRFDYLNPEVDLSCLKLEVEPQLLNTFDGEMPVGLARHFLWERLSFLMSLTGQQPLSNLAHGIRFDGATELTFVDKYSKLVDVKFDKCYYFGDAGLPEFNIDSDGIVCYDWIAFNRGGKHSIDYIETTDNFVKEIWFYSSDRIDGKTEVKDACVVSYLLKKHIEDFNYSETMARFKLVHEMEERGMKGRFNGHGPNGKPKYYKFRTSCISRRVGRTPKANRLQEGNIETPEVSEKALLEILPVCSEKYTKILRYL